MLERIALDQNLVDWPTSRKPRIDGGKVIGQPGPDQRLDGTISERLEEERRGHHRSRTGADRGQE